MVLMVPRSACGVETQPLFAYEVELASAVTRISWHRNGGTAHRWSTDG